MPSHRTAMAAWTWRRRVSLGAVALAVAVGWWWRGSGDSAREQVRSAPKIVETSAPAASPLARAKESEDESALRVAELAARSADERYARLTELLPAWADRDPQGAWRWALTHDREWGQSGQPSPTELVLARLAATEPLLIATVLFSGGVPDPVHVDQGVAALLQAHRTEESGVLLAAWARADGGEQDARAPFERVAFALAKDSPGRAAEWLLALPASANRDAGLAVVANGWAARDPAAAIAWAQALPAGETRQLAVERAFAGWVEQDGEAALRWLVANEAAPDADRLIARWLAISEKIRSNPGVAPAWLALIRDPALRARSAEMFPSP